MKTLAVPTALLLAAGLCAAQDIGAVISSTPVLQPVTVARQVCSNEAVQRCTMHPMVENRVAYFQVVYELAGKQYTVQMDQDPGAQVQLQVAPADTGPQPTSAPIYVQSELPPLAQLIYAQPVLVNADPLWMSPYRLYRAPIGINLQFGFGGHRGHRGHWR